MWRAIEPLWIAALGAQFIVLGGLLLPRIIRLLGRGGAAETVEWAVWMSMLFVFPPLVWLIGWVAPKVIGRGASALVKRGIVALLMLELAIYAALNASPTQVIPILAAAGSVSLLMWRERSGELGGTATLLAMISGTAAWIASGTLVYWQSATSWILASPITVVVVIATVLIGGLMLKRWAFSEDEGTIRIVDFVPLLVLVAFSFRTFPMVEFYHWGFFIGPIEQLRQGGTLLWDTPSQYGFLSILIPSILPGSAWQSFWFFQSFVYAAVACLMYVSIRRLAAGWYGGVAAFLITLTTLFFRPRTEALILPAQMTPAAGPFRFMWCFVMLAFLVRWQTREDSGRGGSRFALVGTIIWGLALLWSAETAIYVTAMWFPALLIHTIQAASRDRLSAVHTAARVLRAAAYPLTATLIVGSVVLAGYRVAGLPGPDIFGHFEYVLLYSSGGFGALPIDPTGTVWYLVLAFLMVVSIIVLHARDSLTDSRLVVWAAVAGGTWALASYFTGRSHPVNLIALIPLLLFGLVACLRLRPFGYSPRARLAVAAAMLPMLAMPVALTAGHREFASAVSETQLAPSSFTDQLPLIDPELQSVLTSAGAAPGDAFVLASDGRLMLGAWQTPNGRELVSRSWLPKAFEIIGSLPENRRQVYFDRNAASFPGEGWLIESRTLSANGADHLLRFLEAGRRLGGRRESEHWVVTEIQAAPLED